MSEEILKEIIIDTINGEEHLGDNLKNQCVNYINKLHHQKQELINWLESKNNITLQQHKIVEPVIKVQEVIDKIKE